MKICIIAQEEYLYFSPFLRKVIEKRNNDIKLIITIGNRGAGNHAKSIKQKLIQVYLLWLIMEPFGFLKSIFITIWYNIIRISGLTGAKFDKRSIEGAAKKYNIPIIVTKDIHSLGIIKKINICSPDIIINQSEHIIKEQILTIPKIGIINRHGSLLPNFRGRLASFWTHAKCAPEYGITIHFIDDGIDSGPIILQKRYFFDPCLSYTKILDIIFKESVTLMLKALKMLSKTGFIPQINKYKGTKIYPFPKLADAREYRKQLKQRRSKK